jgi:hypothetical protein
VVTLIYKIAYKYIYISKNVITLDQCFRLNYRLPTVTGIFSSALVRLRLTDYDSSVFDIPVFVSVWLKNGKVKTGDVFFRPFPSIFTPMHKDHMGY